MTILCLLSNTSGLKLGYNSPKSIEDLVVGSLWVNPSNVKTGVPYSMEVSNNSLHSLTAKYLRITLSAQSRNVWISFFLIFKPGAKSDPQNQFSLEWIIIPAVALITVFAVWHVSSSLEGETGARLQLSDFRVYRYLKEMCVVSVDYTYPVH